MNTTNLMEIVYPVFKIGNEKPSVIEGVSLIIRTYEIEGKLVHKHKIVDDKNLPYDTLALRRLYLYKQGIPLKQLSQAVFFLGDLIKLAHRSTWFIDSHGKIFRYNKTTSVSLLFRKITLQINIPTGGSIIEVEDLPNRFKCLYTPINNEKYAGILKYGQGYILYGLYKEKPKNSRRMI